ncbi:MAG: phytoene/squalene synthase family protein [Actinomycetota bacterium]
MNRLALKPTELRSGRSVDLATRWHARALTAADITDPRLCEAYEHCRTINAGHGSTYYLAALLLPPAARPHVYALYAFARTADEFVDSLSTPDPQGLLTWSAAAINDLRRGSSTTDPVLAATAHTVRELNLDVQLFEDFLAAMKQDITITRYSTYEDLRDYMWGSACVIGLMMLPLLAPLTDDARPHAAALGEGFQMANFIRDVGEDLLRGRIYLPQADLDRFNVTEAELGTGVTTPAIRALLAFEIHRTRRTLDFAAQGIRHVHPMNRPCLETALTLYGGILDEVERADYQVLRSRVRVPRHRRVRVAAPALRRALSARRDTTKWRDASAGTT